MGAAITNQSLYHLTWAFQEFPCLRIYPPPSFHTHHPARTPSLTPFPGGTRSHCEESLLLPEPCLSEPHPLPASLPMVLPLCPGSIAPNSCRICVIRHLPRLSTSPSNFLPTCRHFQVSPTFNRMKPLLLSTSALYLLSVLLCRGPNLGTLLLLTPNFSASCACANGPPVSSLLRPTWQTLSTFPGSIFPGQPHRLYPGLWQRPICPPTPQPRPSPVRRPPCNRSRVCKE